MKTYIHTAAHAAVLRRRIASAAAARQAAHERGDTAAWCAHARRGINLRNSLMDLGNAVPWPASGPAIPLPAAI